MSSPKKPSKKTPRETTKKTPKTTPQEQDPCCNCGGLTPKHQLRKCSGCEGLYCKGCEESIIVHVQDAYSSLLKKKNNVPSFEKLLGTWIRPRCETSSCPANSNSSTNSSAHKQCQCPPILMGIHHTCGSGPGHVCKDKCLPQILNELSFDVPDDQPSNELASSLEGSDKSAVTCDVPGCGRKAAKLICKVCDGYR